MLIEQTTVDELYAMPGFEDMIAEYRTLAIKRLPEPKYRKEDYIPMEKLGMLTVYCVKAEGRVVGFMSIVRSKIPHYGITLCIVESLFVCAAHRSGGAGVRFIDRAEGFAKSLFSAGLFIQCPFGQELAKVLERKGYSPETISYFKPL